jgi:hypothetical protein
VEKEMWEPIEVLGLGFLITLHQGIAGTDFGVGDTIEHEEDGEGGEDSDEWDDDTDIEPLPGPQERWDKLFSINEMAEIVDKHRRGVSMSSILHNHRRLPDDPNHFNVLIHR